MKNIKFVSYTGEYPNLCSGILTVKINETPISFGYNFNKEGSKPNYPPFWRSGGRCGFDDDYNESVIGSIPWELLWDSEDVESYRKEYSFEIWEIIPEILKVMNENVPGGCCGGCI